LQFGSLAKELQKAGLPQDAAVRIATILGNSGQPMRRGPETTDTTNPAMAQVSSNDAKHWLTNTDFKEGDPDHRPQRTNKSENKSRPTQASSLQSTKTPQATDKPFNISGGTYTSTSAEGDGTAIGLNVKGKGMFLAQDGEANSLLGIKIRADCDPGKYGILRFFEELRGNELLLRLSLDENALQDLIESKVNSLLNGSRFTGGGPSILDALVSVSLTAECLQFKTLKGQNICIPLTDCATTGEADGT
jgi:hypothetical protein